MAETPAGGDAALSVGFGRGYGCMAGRQTWRFEAPFSSTSTPPRPAWAMTQFKFLRVRGRSWVVGIVGAYSSVVRQVSLCRSTLVREVVTRRPCNVPEVNADYRHGGWFSGFAARGCVRRVCGP